jgi:hypothetical protein
MNDMCNPTSESVLANSLKKNASVQLNHTTQPKNTPTMSRFKLFRQVTILSALICFVVNGWGQSTANYAFTTNTTGSLALDMNGNAVDMTTGTTSLVASAIDQGASSLTNIGFNFVFMGNLYSQFSASSNGTMALGGTAIGTAIYSASGGTITTPLITPWGSDATTTTNGVLSKLIGTAPNRCLVIEFNMALYYLGSAPASQMQVRLYETSGVVEFVYGAMAMGTSTTTGAIGFAVGATTNSLASITNSTNTVSTSTWAANATTVSSPVSNLNSSSNGSRRVYRFTPPSNTPGNPSSLTFTAVTATTETPNWVDNSSGESFFIITRANDAAFTTGVVVTNVASTTSSGTGTSYTLAQTGLTPGTTYYYKIQAANEAGIVGGGTTGSQATTAGATYYWVGATGGAWNTATNWNTAANNTGTTRTVVATTDVLIVDGAGTTAGGAMSISVDLASFSIGQLKVTSNTALTLASSATATRTITITGGGGDDFIIENGSSLTLNNATNAIAFAFSGTGNTGDISGTLSFAGSASNLLTTTGGTGTLVTVSSTGIVNIGFTAIALVGSATTLVFSNGSNCNITGTTTGAYPIPLATWGASSTLTLSGSSTSSTTATNNVQTLSLIHI